MDIIHFSSPPTNDFTLTHPTMSQPTPSPTRLTHEETTPLSPTTQLTPETPSSCTFAPLPTGRSRTNSTTAAYESPYHHYHHHHRHSSNQVTLREALQQGPPSPVTVPKNPRRLSGLEANLSRLERRKSKAWSGEGVGIVGDGGEGEGEGGEGEGEGERRKSGPLDAEELKVLVFGKLRRLSRFWSNRAE